MIYTENELEDLIMTIISTTLESKGKDDVKARTLTHVILRIIREDREAHATINKH